MDLFMLKTTLLIDKSNIKIGRNISMRIEILMINTILTQDTIIILLIVRGMINLRTRVESTITHHQKDSITRSNKRVMWLLINLSISNMS